MKKHASMKIWEKIIYVEEKNKRSYFFLKLVYRYIGLSHLEIPGGIWSVFNFKMSIFPLV